jgi:hypothetical protein
MPENILRYGLGVADHSSVRSPQRNRNILAHIQILISSFPEKSEISVFVSLGREDTSWTEFFLRNGALGI